MSIAYGVVDMYAVLILYKYGGQQKVQSWYGNITLCSNILVIINMQLK